MKAKLITILSAVLLAGQAFSQQKMDTQAHRGGMALMPENTVASMLNGVKSGIKTLEMDVVISSDGKVVVSHDLYMSADFMRKPDGTDIDKADEKNLALYHMTYDSIRTYDAGSKPHPRFPAQAKMKTYKPLLSDLVDSVETYVKKNRLKPVYYSIEIKSSPTGDGTFHPAIDVFVAKVLDVLAKTKIGKRLIIQSFDVRALQEVHKSDPKIKLSYLVGKVSLDEDLAKLGFTPAIYSPYYTFVTRELVDKTHKQNMLIVPWTVDDDKSIAVMGEMGADGIISNYPDKLVKQYGSYQSR
nr:glycerophosphodiester phosphodiesterase family protein [Mucilaginibacter sp. L294]